MAQRVLATTASICNYAFVVTRASGIEPHESIRRIRYSNEQSFTTASLLTGMKGVCVAAVKPLPARLGVAFADDTR
jgi:hypothetical protein